MFHEPKILFYKMKKKKRMSTFENFTQSSLIAFLIFYRGTQLVGYQATGSPVILVDFDVQAESLLCFLVTKVKLDVLLANAFVKSRECILV